MKTRVSIINSISGILYYIVSIVAGIISRRAVISILGIEYQGISGLFSSVLTMLSIAEFGIGSAIVFHLYEPLKNDDIDKTRSLMAFYKKCYAVVAGLILVLGLIIIPILPFLIKDYTLPYPLTKIYLCFLADSVFSYILAHRRSLLIADQKNYVVSIFDTVYIILFRTVQIAVLAITKNFILFLLCMVVFRIVENILIYAYTDSRYPYLRETGAKPLQDDVYHDIITKVKGAFFHKIGGFIVLGTDNILISKMLGLAISGIYSNYALLINTIQSIITTALTSIIATIGNLLLDKDSDNIFNVFKEIRLLNFLITSVAATGIYCLSSGVVGLFFGKQYTLDRMTVFVLAFNFALQAMRGTYSSFKEAAGVLYEDRFVPLIESAINIAASLLFLKYFGLAGIFMGTIASTLFLYIYSYPKFVYKGVIKQKVSDYWINLVWEILVIVASMLLTEKICSLLVTEFTWWTLILMMIIVALISVLIAFAGYIIWKEETKALFNRIWSTIVGSRQ